MTKQQVIAGRNPVLELLRSESEVEKVLLSKSASGDVIREILQLCRERGIPAQSVPEIKIQSFSKANHQGVIAFTALVQYYNVQEVLDFIFSKGEDPLLLILDNVTDVRNLGAAARSALGLGAHAIIVPKKESAAVNDVSVKISAGALLKIPVCRVENLAVAVKDIKNNGIKIVALDGSAGAYVHDIDARTPMALVAGSEDEGISPAVLKLADERIRLPMQEGLESYNVSVAAAIALYEIHRQRTAAS